MTSRTGRTAPSGAEPTWPIVLEARAERRLIASKACTAHVVFTCRVPSSGQGHAARDRLPLTLGLVLDRSGSMHGGKLETAKQAVLSVLERLDDRDRVAVVTFDDRIEVLQPSAPASSGCKSAIREALLQVDARGSTALHEGWLTGCQAIADARPSPSTPVLARCFLLTDGLANVGETDPETIATQATGIREQTGVGTSTFGIGGDYDEHLLAPMAVAGAGQFHHLRGNADIGNTFVGELGELLAVTAPQVRLEIMAESGVSLELVSPYALQPSAPAVSRWTVSVGDLMAGEERHIATRLSFPDADEGRTRVVQGRIVWKEGLVEHAGAWHEVTFTTAGEPALKAEQPDLEALRIFSEHLAEQARRIAALRNQQGDLVGAVAHLRAMREDILQYASSDATLLGVAADLRESEEALASPVSPMMAKEIAFSSVRRARGQRDHRAPIE